MGGAPWAVAGDGSAAARTSAVGSVSAFRARRLRTGRMRPAPRPCRGPRICIARTGPTPTPVPRTSSGPESASGAQRDVCDLPPVRFMLSAQDPAAEGPGPVADLPLAQASTPASSFRSWVSTSRKVRASGGASTARFVRVAQTCRGPRTNRQGRQDHRRAVQPATYRAPSGHAPGACSQRWSRGQRAAASNHGRQRTDRGRRCEPGCCGHPERRHRRHHRYGQWPARPRPALAGHVLRHRRYRCRSKGQRGCRGRGHRRRCGR